MVLGKKEGIENGKWIVQATGNCQPIEYVVGCAELYSRIGFNALFINDPSVGRSGGHAIPQSLGEAQETGIRFLETALKAKQIAIAGFSLGGAMVGQAILQHRFRKDVDYLVIRQVTFDRTSNIAKKIMPIFKSVAKHLVLWTGLEMDSIEASKKLQRLGIREVIIQASKKAIDRTSVPNKEDFETDGVIPARGSLGYRLVKEGVTYNKIFRCLEKVGHNNVMAIFEATLDELKKYYTPSK